MIIAFFDFVEESTTYRLPLRLMKKWLTFLLLFITMAGTFYPCCLVDECDDEENATAQKENQPKTEGNCSPLFPCANCPGFTGMLKSVQIIQPRIENPAHHETLIVFNLSTYSSSFWQPPRYC